VSNTPARYVAHPAWHAAFDTEAAASHFGMPGAGAIKEDGKVYAFVPSNA
jgi:hypothetical protein